MTPGLVSPPSTLTAPTTTTMVRPTFSTKVIRGPGRAMTMPARMSFPAICSLASPKRRIS